MSNKRKVKNIFAKKSLGQNFLHNPLVREDIIDAAGDIRDQQVLEIGPGLGFLTTKLLKAGAIVTAIELDDRVIEVLQRDFGHMDNFHLIHGDILDQNLDVIFGEQSYQIIANIPYNITARLLRKFLAETQNRPTRAILMIQKEVARKLCEKKNSILKLSVDVFAETKTLFEVPRENFSPAPKVDSAVISLAIHSEPLVQKENQKLFFDAINAGFSEKRKKLGNFLGRFFGVDSVQILGGIDPNRRAETLSLEEWQHVTRNLAAVLASKQQK